jgi:hypothetical protein
VRKKWVWRRVAVRSREKWMGKNNDWALEEGVRSADEFG